MLSAVAPMLGAIVTVYGLVAGASSLLQARQMVRRGTSSDVSLAFLGLYVAGYGLWLLYGFSINSLPLILVDAVGLLCGASTLVLAVRLRRPARRRTERRAAVRESGRSPRGAPRASVFSGPGERAGQPARPRGAGCRGRAGAWRGGRHSSTPSAPRDPLDHGGGRVSRTVSEVPAPSRNAPTYAFAASRGKTGRRAPECQRGAATRQSRVPRESSGSPRRDSKTIVLPSGDHVGAPS